MFERFSEKALKVVMLSQEEARRMGHYRIGTEQLLLGLIRQSSDGVSFFGLGTFGTSGVAKILKSMNVDLKQARTEVEKIIGKGDGILKVQIPFTNHAKQALEISRQKADDLEQKSISTEHLLFALTKIEESVAVKVLRNLKVDLSKLQNKLLEQLKKNGSIENREGKPLGDKIPRIKKPSSTGFSGVTDFAGFNQRAIETIVLAQNEAKQLGQDFIGTEELLLGLILEKSGSAGKCLKSMQINLIACRSEIEKIVGKRECIEQTNVEFSPRALHVLELAHIESNQLGQDYVGTGHLLLGILREGNGVAMQVLKNLSIDTVQLRQMTSQELTNRKRHDA